jgi:hypothetical protein
LRDCAKVSGLAAGSGVQERQLGSSRSPVFLTNNTRLTPAAIGELYWLRWQVELFFKWIKKHLRLKALFSTSKNAVKTQIWIAIATDVLIAIVKGRNLRFAAMPELIAVPAASLDEPGGFTPQAMNRGSSEATKALSMRENDLEVPDAGRFHAF